MLPWDPLWRLRHVGYPVSPRGYRGLPAFASLSMAGSARLQVLHHRLDAVREIKDGMGLHSPKVEELATRKMRAENPELASDWDAMRLAVRQHEAKQAKEQKQAQSRGQSLSLGLSRSK